MNGMMLERPLTREEVRDRMKQYHAQIAPIVRQMAMIDSFRPPPRILLNPDGSMEIGERAPLPPESQAMWDQCQAMIDMVRKSLFPEQKAPARGVPLPPGFSF
jgi:hypothetical protein